MAIFSVFNPLGPPLPQVLLAQIVGMAVIGASGHLWGLLVSKMRGSRFLTPGLRGLQSVRMTLPEVLAAGLGAGFTLIYSVLADYGFAVAIGKWSTPLPVIAVGLPLSAVHVVSNALIFGGLGAFLVRSGESIREGRNR